MADARKLSNADYARARAELVSAPHLAVARAGDTATLARLRARHPDLAAAADDKRAKDAEAAHRALRLAADALEAAKAAHRTAASPLLKARSSERLEAAEREHDAALIHYETLNGT